VVQLSDINCKKVQYGWKWLGMGGWGFEGGEGGRGDTAAVDVDTGK